MSTDSNTKKEGRKLGRPPGKPLPKLNWDLLLRKDSFTLYEDVDYRTLKEEMVKIIRAEARKRSLYVKIIEGDISIAVLVSTEPIKVA